MEKCHHAFNDETITEDGRETCIFCGEPKHEEVCKKELTLANELLEKQCKKYMEAYKLFMDEIWEIIPDENREYLDKQFKKLGID